MTEAEGLAPQEVEQLVTYPIETAMSGMPGVVRVRSTSGVGLSIVYVEFGWDTEIYRARSRSPSGLAVQGALPHGVAADGTDLLDHGRDHAGRRHRATVSPMELREIADFVIRPQLLTIPGVAQVIPIGGEVRQYRVAPDSADDERARSHPEQMEGADAASAPTPAAASSISTRANILIRNIGLTTASRTCATSSSPRPGHSILLRQVAQVEFAPRVKRGDAGFMGAPPSSSASRSSRPPTPCA